MTREERHAHIEKELSRCHPTLRRKARAVISDLEGHGWEPTIGSGWRSLAEQKQIVAAGNSTVLFSFHNATTENGLACALAVDIVDHRWGWDSPSKFWNQLGHSAQSHGLTWGGTWKRFPDVAHVQLLPNSFLSKVKRGYIPPVT